MLSFLRPKVFYTPCSFGINLLQYVIQNNINTAGGATEQLSVEIDDTPVYQQPWHRRGRGRGWKGKEKGGGKGATATLLDIRPQISTVNKQSIRDQQRNGHFSARLRSRGMNINVIGLSYQNFVAVYPTMPVSFAGNPQLINLYGRKSSCSVVSIVNFYLN